MEVPLERKQEAIVPDKIAEVAHSPAESSDDEEGSFDSSDDGGDDEKEDERQPRHHRHHHQPCFSHLPPPQQQQQLLLPRFETRPLLPTPAMAPTMPSSATIAGTYYMRRFASSIADATVVVTPIVPPVSTLDANNKSKRHHVIS